MPAPSAASVGASAAPTSSASQMLPPVSASASKVPRPIVSGSATHNLHVKARIHAQLMQPDPGRVREQH